MRGTATLAASARTAKTMTDRMQNTRCSPPSHHATANRLLMRRRNAMNLNLNGEKSLARSARNRAVRFIAHLRFSPQRTPGGFGRDRIVGPGMPGIAPAHLRAHGRVAPAPES